MANFLSSISVDGAIEISSGKRIRWGSGDAQIEEGSTANYALDFSTYDGSSMTKALTLLGDNSATFTGSITAAISADSNSTYTGIVVSESGLLKYRTKSQILSDIGATGNTGTVTSVAVTVGTGLDVSGSPITSSGTIDIDLDLTEITVGAGLDTTATGISLDLNELSSATGAMGSSDKFVLVSSGGLNRKSTPNLIGLSLFNNDAGFTTNTGTVTGTGSSGRIALWNSSTGLTSDSDFQWNSSSNKLVFEGDYSMSDNSGSFELNHDNSDINTKIFGFGGNGSLNIQENSVFTSASGFYVPSGYGISAGTTATASNTIRATGNIIAFYSDERLKDFESNIPDALDKVCKLNGYYYKQNEKAAELGFENHYHL